MAESGRPRPTQRDYIARVNRVIDHIQANLDGDLTLAELARVAHFSPYHFHRIFRALVGETCKQFVRRLRLERAAHKLVYSPSASITAIALDAGFSSSESFARAFRDCFGVTASEWRTRAQLDTDGEFSIADRKIGQVIRKPAHSIDVQATYGPSGTISWRLTMNQPSKLTATVEVHNRPAVRVAYLRHIGPYAGNQQLFAELFGKLAHWAGARGLLGRPDALFMSMYHDDPSVTEADKLRMSACIPIPEGTGVDGEIGETTVPGGRYASARFEINADQYAQAWEAIYGGWLPNSGFEPDDRPAIEVYHNNPQEHPEGKHIVEMLLPVKAG